MKDSLFIAAALLGAASSAGASELTYRPVNPSFGGNGLNSTFLMQGAQVQGMGAKKDRQQQQFPDINFPDLGNVTGGTPIIIIGGNGLPVIPESP
jgi:curli production assembly/transport component CsgF